MFPTAGFASPMGPWWNPEQTRDLRFAWLVPGFQPCNWSSRSPEFKVVRFRFCFKCGSEASGYRLPKQTPSWHHAFRQSTPYSLMQGWL